MHDFEFFKGRLINLSQNQPKPEWPIFLVTKSPTPHIMNMRGDFLWFMQLLCQGA
jgi:hypothetical protein